MDINVRAVVSAAATVTKSSQDNYDHARAMWKITDMETPLMVDAGEGSTPDPGHNTIPPIGWKPQVEILCGLEEVRSEV